jgi:hypothetical protein
MFGPGTAEARSVAARPVQLWVALALSEAAQNCLLTCIRLSERVLVAVETKGGRPQGSFGVA